MIYQPKQVIITKAAFCYLMDAMQKQQEKETQFATAMSELFEKGLQSHVSDDLADALIKLMAVCFGGKDFVKEATEELEWWIYETDFGRKTWMGKALGQLLIDGVWYDVTSASAFYDAMCGNYSLLKPIPQPRI